MDPPIAFAAFGGCLGYIKRLLLDKQLVPLGSAELWRPCDGPQAPDGVG